METRLEVRMLQQRQRTETTTGGTKLSVLEDLFLPATEKLKINAGKCWMSLEPKIESETIEVPIRAGFKKGTKITLAEKEVVKIGTR